MRPFIQLFPRGKWFNATQPKDLQGDCGRLGEFLRSGGVLLGGGLRVKLYFTTGTSVPSVELAMRISQEQKKQRNGLKWNRELNELWWAIRSGGSNKSGYFWGKCLNWNYSDLLKVHGHYEQNLVIWKC